MSNDIDNLIAEADGAVSQYLMGTNPPLFSLVTRLAAALESRQTTTREKLALTIHRLALQGSGGGAPWTREEWSDAILAADIFVDADKIAADAWDEALKLAEYVMTDKALETGYWWLDTWVSNQIDALPVNPYRASVTAPTETEKP